MRCLDCSRPLQKSEARGSLKHPFCKECFEQTWDHKSYKECFLLENEELI